MLKRLLFTLSVMLMPLQDVMAEAGSSVADALVSEAVQRELHEDPYWLRLGHYRDGLFGIESEVDGKDFFIAEDGKTNPRSELEATIRAWFEDRRDTEIDTLLQCRFVARYAWLDEQLDLAAHRPAPECPTFDEWFEAINPGSLTLIFPSSYLNNPASMYGHTLLRIDPPESRADLASYAINFAARTQETNGFVFAVKGLTGMYDGYFALLPYYRKVNEYNDIENRDIWEYPLDFTREEIRRLLLHLWEVGPASMEYYFFDENCSYQLLTLFDVARPGLALSDEYFYQVIPADTVRATVREAGLLDDVKYRASLTTRLGSHARQLDDAQLQQAQALAAGRVSPADVSQEFSARDAAQVLDMAYLLIQHRHFSEGGEQAPSSSLALPLLKARAALEVNDVFDPVAPPDAAPHRGHGTSRITLGAGEVAERRYGSIAWRAAYHDLLDPRPGFLDGAAITMFEGEARRYEQGSTLLQELTLVEVESLSPRDRLFTPLSWQVAAGWERRETGAMDEPLAFTLAGGAGGTWEFAGGIVSLQLGAKGWFEKSLPGDTAFAVVPRLLYVANPAGRWNVQLEMRQENYVGGLEGHRERVSLGQQFMLADNVGLRLALAREAQSDETAKRYYTQADLSLLLYY